MLGKTSWEKERKSYGYNTQKIVSRVVSTLAAEIIWNIRYFSGEEKNKHPPLEHAETV